MGANNVPWEQVAEPARSELRALYADLGAEVPFSTKRLAERWAKLVTETWALADGVSQEAAILAIRRRMGTGRRPTRQVVASAARRQALQLDTAAKALSMLRELTGRTNGHRAHAADDLAARLLRLPVLSPSASGQEADP